MTNFNINVSTIDGLKTEWEELRASGNGLDFERAVFLYNVLVDKLDDDLDLLRKFITNVLEEFAGKRTEKFVRMVQALDKIDDEHIWRSVGGACVILLARVPTRNRKKVIAKVATTLERTGRDAVSEQTFRSIMRDTLGSDGYRAALTESRSEFYQSSSYKEQVRILKGQIFDLLPIPGVREALNDEARKLLGMLSRRQEGAKRRRRKAS